MRIPLFKLWSICGRCCCILSLLCVFLVAVRFRGISLVNDELSTIKTSISIHNNREIDKNGNDVYYYNLSTIDDPAEKSKLVNLTNFRFVINSNGNCSSNKSHSFLVILVHSAPNHFERRKSVRKTWGSVQTIGNTTMKLMFLVGTVNQTQTQTALQQESSIYKDIIQGNFVDSYRNLTYKHVMGLKWVTYYCGRANYVLKVDDDVFVDIFQIVNFLTGSGRHDDTVFNPNDIYCSVCRKCFVKRGYRTEKWRVSFKDYDKRYFPPFCAGIGIILSPSVASRLYVASSRVPFFWIDDVYVSGILAESAGIGHVDISERVTFYESVLDDWLDTSSPSQPPVIIAHSKHFDKVVYAAWNKTLNYYQRSVNIRSEVPTKQ